MCVIEYHASVTNLNAEFKTSRMAFAHAQMIALPTIPPLRFADMQIQRLWIREHLLAHLPASAIS